MGVGIFAGAGGWGDTGGVDEFEVDASEVDARGSGGLIDQEGVYHLQIADAKWEDAPNKQGRREMSLRLECVFNVPGQSPAGSIIYHRAELPTEDDKNDKNGKGPLYPLLLASIGRLAAAFGLFRVVKQEDNSERFIDLATNSMKWQLSTLPQRLKGLQVIGRPKRREYTRANGDKGSVLEFQYGRGFSAPGDPQNANVPMCPEFLEAGGYKKADPPVATAAPAAQPAKRSAASRTPNVPATSPAQGAAPATASAQRPQQQSLPLQAAPTPAALAEDPYSEY